MYTDSSKPYFYNAEAAFFFFFANKQEYGNLLKQ